MLFILYLISIVFCKNCSDSNYISEYNKICQDILVMLKKNNKNINKCMNKYYKISKRDIFCDKKKNLMKIYLCLKNNNL